MRYYRKKLKCGLCPKSYLKPSPKRLHRIRNLSIFAVNLCMWNIGRYLVVTRQTSCDVHIEPKKDANTANRTKCFTESVFIELSELLSY